MNAARWQKVKGLFDAVVELAPEKRKAFLDKSCGGDEELRRDVENLLASFDEADSFMEQPAAREVASLMCEPRATMASGKAFAHYEIIKQIGAGGMGEVYLAQDKKLDRQVAIKILNQQFSQHQANLQRFTREAKSASSLNHPHILVIHEIGTVDDLHYIASEFIEGKTLREYIGKAPMELAEVLDCAIQIAQALAAAHRAHIVHRDIKPENIMIRPDGYVKILDFGLAKLLEQNIFGLEDPTIKQNQTAKGVILGTVNYMSPEQAKGEAVDERTDMFSFGVLLYEMIAGQIPFAGASLSETFANLINGEPQPLSRFAANVPEELQRIVARLLKKNRDERYQTMKDLLTDLKDLRENLAFDERLEKSHSPDNLNATVIMRATTGNQSNRTDETINLVTGQVRRHKSLAAIVLAVLLVGIIGLGYYLFSVKKSASSAKVKKSLAVLPFVNASQEPNADFLSDGITESIINNLSQLEGLRVMSRNSAFRFKNNQTDPKTIASQLAVESLVTGDIKQIGDKYVINVRLINASDDSQIWGNQYVKTSGNLLAAQTEIAQAVAQNLRIKLSSSEQQRLKKNYTANVEAYQLYLRGRFHVYKLTPPEVYKGISYLQQAIDIDPNYALAYAGIADAYRTLALSAEMLPSETMPKSKAAADKAIEIDDELSEGHTALGMTLFWSWDWQGAENQFKRALDLNPDSAPAHLSYAHLLSNTGRHTEALSEAKRARELDPLFLVGNAFEGLFLFNAGRPDEAIDRLQKTVELAPNFWMPHLFIASACIDKGMYAEAIAEVRTAREYSPILTASTSYEGYALAKTGRRDEAKAVLNALLKLSTERFVPPYHIAIIYNGLGENDKTFEWLEKGYEQHDPKMAFLKVDLKLSNLRDDPRFKDLLQRMNFPS